jgi:hypothetical protein
VIRVNTFLKLFPIFAFQVLGGSAQTRSVIAEKPETGIALTTQPSSKCHQKVVVVSHKRPHFLADRASAIQRSLCDTGNAGHAVSAVFVAFDAPSAGHIPL